MIILCIILWWQQATINPSQLNNCAFDLSSEANWLSKTHCLALFVTARQHTVHSVHSVQFHAWLVAVTVFLFADWANSFQQVSLQQCNQLANIGHRLLLGLPTQPELAGDSRNSTQSPASRPTLPWRWKSPGMHRTCCYILYSSLSL